MPSEGKPRKEEAPVMTHFTLTMNKAEIERFSEPYGSRNYHRLKGTKLLVRLKDGHIVTQETDWLTEDEVREVHRLMRTAVNDENGRSSDVSDRKWAETAVRRELEAIGRLHGDNPHRPDSEFWACLIRIASVVKGSGRQHIAPAQVRSAILANAPLSLKTKGKREKDLTYLFGRAMNAARPRYRIRS